MPITNIMLQTIKKAALLAVIALLLVAFFIKMIP